MIKQYTTGKEFLEESREFLAAFPLETIFFEKNARMMENGTEDGFILRVSREDRRTLWAIQGVKTSGSFPMVLYGETELCGELAEYLYAHGLSFRKVLGSLDMTEAFLTAYEALAGGSHCTNMEMQIMRCSRAREADTSSVEWAKPEDAEELAALLQAFYLEATHAKREFAYALERVREDMAGWAVVRRDGEIVSMAKIVRETEKLGSVTDVYTRPEFRGMGLSRQAVTFLTEYLLERGKLAYLFVDQSNPISNHLYRTIGYEYDIAQYEVRYMEDVAAISERLIRQNMEAYEVLSK